MSIAATGNARPLFAERILRHGSRVALVALALCSGPSGEGQTPAPSAVYIVAPHEGTLIQGTQALHLARGLIKQVRGKLGDNRVESWEVLQVQSYWQVKNCGPYPVCEVLMAHEINEGDILRYELLMKQPGNSKARPREWELPPCKLNGKVVQDFHCRNWAKEEMANMVHNYDRVRASYRGPR